MTAKTIRQKIQGGLDARTDRPDLKVVPKASATPWMDAVAAAEYTGFTADALKQMRYLGTGPAYSKPAGRVRYHLDDLDTFMREGRRSA